MGRLGLGDGLGRLRLGDGLGRFLLGDGLGRFGLGDGLGRLGLGRLGLDDGPGRLSGLGGAAGHAVVWCGHRVLDRRQEPAFFTVAVVVPRCAPNAVQVPTQVPEHLLTKPVAVAGGPGGVVLVAVAFDAEGVHAGMAGVVDADVDAVPGGADPRGEAVSPGADDLDDGVFERGFGVTVGAADGRERGSAAGGVVKITAQVPLVADAAMSVARTLLTISLRYRARVMATLSLRHPPCLLSGPKSMVTCPFSSGP